MISVAQIVGTAASVICTIIVGALAFFIKKTLSGLEDADKKHEEQIKELSEKSASQIKDVAEKSAAQTKLVEDKLNDLRSDLPLIYVTREDYIRTMNSVEKKLDQLLYMRKENNANDG